MGKVKKFICKESVSGVIFTMPFIIGAVLFLFVPLGISLYYAFCDYNILSPAVFTGLDNFKNLFKDELFYQSLKVTLFYTVVSVPLKLIFALLVAMLFQKTTRAAGIYRGLYYLPSIIGGFFLYHPPARQGSHPSASGGAAVPGCSASYPLAVPSDPEPPVQTAWYLPLPQR